MPWFKIDDSFESHPKVKAIPRARRLAAVGLWTLAGSWSARQLTDGFVPNFMLTELAASKREANTLIEVGLWLSTEGGYTFKDWHDWQPTKAKVEADRDAAKERMRVARERKKGGGSADVRANESATPPNGSREVRSTPRSLTPTRPDPTRPDPKEGTTSRELTLAEAPRDDVTRLCDHLADRIEANGAKRPIAGKTWRDAARLMLDNDGRSEAEVHQAIDWCQADEFWRANVLSMPKLREKYDQLKLQAQRKPKVTGRNQQQSDLLSRAMARAEERERNGA